ncbi:MAG: hypothetical protein V3V14_09965 [Saprospiraceae bacterium]
MKYLFTFLSVFFIANSGFSQFGYGVTASTDVYHYYQNPEDNTGVSTSAGSLLLNLGVGPKLWLGAESFSVSIEAQATIGLFGLSVKDYKGLGTVSYPILAKLNFGGLSGLDKEGKFGLSIGAGIQYTKTELYYLTDEFEAKGGKRELYKVYVGQIGYGFGMSGVSAQAFVRYGYDPETNAKVFNFGVQYDLNLPKMKDISDPNSEL